MFGILMKFKRLPLLNTAVIFKQKLFYLKIYISNAEKINLLFMSKSFFDRRGEKRRLSGAKTRLFNEVYRKVAKTEM